MYELSQSRSLANELLNKPLNKCGYHQSKVVSELWKHKWRPVKCILVVDIIRVKYVGEEHRWHINDTLEEEYKVTTEWDNKRYSKNNTRLGSQEIAGSPVTTRIHQENTQSILTWHEKETIIPSSSSDNQVWDQKSMFHTRVQSSPCRCNR
jgi:hypothetical protein